MDRLSLSQGHTASSHSTTHSNLSLQGHQQSCVHPLRRTSACDHTPTQRPVPPDCVYGCTQSGLGTLQPCPVITTAPSHALPMHASGRPELLSALYVLYVFAWQAGPFRAVQACRRSISGPVEYRCTCCAIVRTLAWKHKYCSICHTQNGARHTCNT